MAKVPVAGRVKTRLARDVGTAEAVRLYRSVSRAVAQRLGRQPFWETLISVTPDADAASRALPRNITRIPQGGGDLGQRMQRPMRTMPPGPVCIIGTDIPMVRRHHIRKAFRLLGCAGTVFCPASDGGFWLVGMRRRPRVSDPYRNVRWSHPETLRDVLANIPASQAALGAVLSDIDDAGDLRRLGGGIGRLILPFPH